MENKKSQETLLENEKEGLPESAEEKDKKKALVISIILIIFIVCCVLFHYWKRSSNDIQKIEENYLPEVQVEQSKYNDKPKQFAFATENNKSSQINKITPEQIELINQKRAELQKRLSAPMLVVNQSNNDLSKSNENSISNNIERDPNTQFMNKISTETNSTINATRIPHLNEIITEGSLIHASLETAVNSDLPGYLRAVVSEDVYSANGSQVLIPQGSRLIGQYKSGMMQGQSRIFVVWTRVITSYGISVNLASEGVDNLGIAGMGADSIDHHFWEQFGIAGLISIIGAGAANTGVNSNDQYNAQQAYRMAVANSFAQTSSQILQQMGVIAPTLHVDQGKSIMVFVAHDVSFNSVTKKYGNRLNVF